MDKIPNAEKLGKAFKDKSTVYSVIALTNSRVARRCGFGLIQTNTILNV